MYDAYWKNPATAWKYLKLFQVLFPFKDFGLATALSAVARRLGSSQLNTSDPAESLGCDPMFDQSVLFVDAM